MPAYYNEHDPQTAAWLRELIRARQIADGEVDERDIRDVTPDELRPFRQHHFFAGIGGWALALRLAGWPDDEPVWTGSCPCQPFSTAGGRKGFADERHLWPAWHWLIAQCRPRVVLGEQVASALGWLDLVFTDLEGEGYACAAVDLCAAGVGAPHIRQRLWWVADSNGGLACDGDVQRGWRYLQQPADAAAVDGLVDTTSPRHASAGRGEPSESEGGECLSGMGRDGGGLGNADRSRPQGWGVQPRAQSSERGPREAGVVERMAQSGSGRREERTVSARPGRSDEAAPDEPWAGAVWIPCADGKARPVESGAEPLAHGVPARVVRLRGYGNAIVPQTAAAFVRAYMVGRGEARA